MRLLWLKTNLLHPVDTGGKIRTYFMLRELKQRHHVTYLALDDGTAAPDAVTRATEYCHKLIRVPHRTSEKFSLRFFAELLRNLGSRLPYAIERYASVEFGRRIAQEQEQADVVVCDFLFPSVNVPTLSRPSVLFQHNVEAVIWRRHAETQSGRLTRMLFRSQWRRMAAFERLACGRYDAIVAVSPQDRSIFERDYAVPMVRDIPTGVDTEYFRPSNVAMKPEPYHLVFSGSMDWLPNDDAIKYFVRMILPKIRASCPEVVLTVVGRKPFPALTALSREDPNIRVTGRVDDVRPFLERAAVYVIPLRIGGGTRLKVFEAMAMEKPVVSTSIGVEGLPVVHGTEVLIADEPDAFADAVVRLLHDSTLARQLGEAAARKVRARFGWAPVADAFIEACESARGRWKQKYDQADTRGPHTTADRASGLNPRQLRTS